MTLYPKKETVKRSYSSPRREQQARETKRVILEAAIELFTERGFQETTVKQIAERASVSEQTVYNVFEDKVGLLVDAGLLYIESGGSPEEAAFLEALRAEPDPLVRIRMAARDSRQTWESGALELELIAFGGQVRDPRLQDLAEKGIEYKLASTRAVCEILFPDSIRRPDTDIDDIVALAVAVDAASTVTTMLRLGWTMDRWEQWVEQLLMVFLDPDWRSKIQEESQ